ncbi:MAG: hypothetical protein GX638_14060 [Crenarchaeota archaeon]|nr:hypothetical protein [Thermoproteota archaeon]
MEKPDENELSKILSDNNTYVLLSKFVSGEVDFLEPVFESKVGFHYPLVESIIGDASHVESYLNKLAAEKILIKKLFNKLIFCPFCGSVELFFRYCCPSCKSFNIQKSGLIEHVTCGYMDLEKNFRKTGKLACPKCNQPLQKIGVDYRKAGVWCSCENCGKNFDLPITEHYCMNCHKISTFEESIIKEYYSYTLAEPIRAKLASNVFQITPILSALVDLGYKVESPALVTGKSGAQHSFDVAAFNKDISNCSIVIDVSIAQEGVVSEQPIITLFAKLFDVKTEKAFLVAIPKIAENARKMAGHYGIRLIEAKNQNEAFTLLKEQY